MSFLGKIFANIMGDTINYPENAVFLDVRNAGEQAHGVVEGAVLLPLGSLMSEITQAIPDKNTPVVVYCASGMRSAGAKKAMIKMGYTQVLNGMNAGHIANKTGKNIVKPHV